MLGVDFILDEHGKKKAVVINLNRYGKLWEDFYDTIVFVDRKKEPRCSLKDVKKRLERKGRL